MTIQSDKMRRKQEWANEQYAKGLRTSKFFGEAIKVPSEIKEDITDDILITIVFSKNKKQTRQELRELLDLWID